MAPSPAAQKSVSLKSTRTGIVTPLAADATSILGRKGAAGALPLEITSPMVSRCQAELVREGASLRLVSRGAHPTAVVRGGVVIRVDKGESEAVQVGDTLVLCTERLIGSSKEVAPAVFDGGDEAFTVVEDGIASSLVPLTPRGALLRSKRP